jgi:hypothetical protein
MKEPILIPIVEHTLILRGGGGVNQYKTIFYFFKHSSTIGKQSHMRSINCRTWNTRFTWKPFREKTTKILFIILCRHQPTTNQPKRHQSPLVQTLVGTNLLLQIFVDTNLLRHQSPLVQTLVGTNLLLQIFVDTNLLETPIPTAKHQLNKRHQSLCLSDTNLQVTIYSLVHITSSKDDNIHITFTESACYFFLHQV